MDRTLFELLVSQSFQRCIQITINNLFSRNHNSDLTNKNHKLTQKNTQNDPKQPTQAKTTQNETQNEPK